MKVRVEYNYTNRGVYSYTLSELELELELELGLGFRLYIGVPVSTVAVLCVSYSDTISSFYPIKKTRVGWSSFLTSHNNESPTPQNK